MLTMALPAPLGRAKTTSLRNITFAIRRSVIPQIIQDLWSGAHVTSIISPIRTAVRAFAIRA